MDAAISAVVVQNREKTDSGRNHERSLSIALVSAMRICKSERESVIAWRSSGVPSFIAWISAMRASIAASATVRI
jgi:hypothetical protein